MTVSLANALLSRLTTALVTISAVVLCVLALVGVRSWLASRRADARLQATLATQKPLLDQAAAREQERDAALEKKLQKIAHSKASVRTPAQALVQIPTLLPALPQPLLPGFAPLSPNEPTPPAATLTVPEPDLKPLDDYLQDCLACQAQLAATRADLTDERAKVSALTVERDAALKTAHGGGFWSGVRKSVKWFLIGGAVGALAASAARH
jgi:hypothetical protein